jgi:hypothetical protein
MFFPSIMGTRGSSRLGKKNPKSQRTSYLAWSNSKSHWRRFAGSVCAHCERYIDKRYERKKVLTAFISITSIVITVLAGIALNLLANEFSTGQFIWVMSAAAILAAFASITSIMQSQRLAKERARHQIFLIYAREDIEAAEKIADELRDHGFKPWLDVEQITPGQVWQKAVIHALEGSTAALVLISKHLSKKGFVQQELATALATLQERENNVSPVIPVRLDESEVPATLSHISWVNLLEENGMERLITGLKRIMP